MSVYQLGPATNLSAADVMSLWTGAGGDPSQAATAAAIVFSSENPQGNAGLVNDTPSTGDYSVGLWQINYYGSLMDAQTARFGDPTSFASDPSAQARAAIAMSSNGTNWQPWGPDFGYSGYSQPVSIPTSTSRVGRWLAAHGYGVSAPAGGSSLVEVGVVAVSMLFLADLAVSYFKPQLLPAWARVRI